MQYEANRIAVFDLHQLCCSHADLPYRTGDDPVATSQTIFSVETPHFSNLILINVDFATAYLLTGGRDFPLHRRNRPMPHKQVLFRSAAREKILRGATQLADAVRVTLGPRSKSVLIEKKLGGADRLQ